MKKFTLTIFFISVLSFTLNSQDLSQVIAFNESNWDFGNTNFETLQYMGKESILISQGGISVKGVEFLNGTIQVDINFPADFSFPGMFFRKQDSGNFESFYVRPHQSGKPDAIQYTPHFNGLAGWQLYFGDGFWQAVDLVPDTWNTIRIDVLNDQADVYMNDMEEPILKISELKRELKSGEIGFYTGPAVHFANFRYSTTDPVLVIREPKDIQEPEVGLISSWELSELVNDEDFQDKSSINLNGLTWNKYPTEENGTINIAKYRTVNDTENTVLAKLTVDASEAVSKKMLFGYSDYTWIYINGQVIYEGKNTYRSRDYRYLGSIGFFDAVYLPLKDGPNEIIFVVSENFGGWGLKARITDLTGIKIK